jgi:hypothetical protein
MDGLPQVCQKNARQTARTTSPDFVSVRSLSEVHQSGAFAGLHRVPDMDAVDVNVFQRIRLLPPAWLRILLMGALLGRAALAGPLAPAPAVHDIDWRTSPLDLNLRGLNGERFRFHCPAGKAKTGQVVGKGPYTDGSSICAAAVHAGVIHAASGGLVTIELRPGEAHYEASWSHFIQSESYDRFWSGSFLVIASDAAEMPSPPLSGPEPAPQPKNTLIEPR